jgi:hypothetical protein
MICLILPRQPHAVEGDDDRGADIGEDGHPEVDEAERAEQQRR